MSEIYRPQIAILASGSGATAEAIIRATQSEALDARVGMVICNNPPQNEGPGSVYGRIARLNEEYDLNIQTMHISGRTHPGGPAARGQTDEESAAICEVLSGYDHVTLAGYMKVVRGALLEMFGYLPEHTSPYQARMTNTHPGPLPETADTFGVHASQKVLELVGRGLLTQSKHTVHVVSAGVDQGHIVAEHDVSVSQTDTAADLYARTQQIEKAMLPSAIDGFLTRQRLYNS